MEVDRKGILVIAVTNGNVRSDVQMCNAGRRPLGIQDERRKMCKGGGIEWFQMVRRLLLLLWGRKASGRVGGRCAAATDKGNHQQQQWRNVSCVLFFGGDV